MKAKNAKKNNRQNRVLVVSRKNMKICAALVIIGILVILSAFLVPARLIWLSGLLLLVGALIVCYGAFAREFFYRCPVCGRSLMKDLPLKKKLHADVPKGCPQCSWATKIEFVD